MDWKEINTAIQERLTAAALGKEGDERESAITSELRSLDQAIRQPIWDAGHGAAVRQQAEKVTAAERQVADQKAAAERAEARLKELEAKTPDAEAIRKQFDSQVKDLQEKHKGEIDKMTSERKADRVDTFRTRLTAAAGAKLDPAYAELQILKMNGRIDVVDGRIVVRQPGKDIPYLADDLDSLVSTVVGELVTGAPADRRLSQGDTGGGASGGSSGGGNADVWTKARERGKELAKPVGTLDKEATARRLSSL
jgi:hypothetical protein